MKKWKICQTCTDWFEDKSIYIHVLAFRDQPLKERILSLSKRVEKYTLRRDPATIILSGYHYRDQTCFSCINLLPGPQGGFRNRGRISTKYSVKFAKKCGTIFVNVWQSAPEGTFILISVCLVREHQSIQEGCHHPIWPWCSRKGSILRQDGHRQVY